MAEGDVYVQSQGDYLDYELDWSAWLAEGDTIASSEWTVEDGDATTPRQTLSGGQSVVWITGGTPGKTCRFVNTVTFGSQRVRQDSVRVRIGTP